MRQKNLELMVGLFVALGLAAFLLLALKVSDLTRIGENEGYRITARFENIGGLKVRAPVTGRPPGGRCGKSGEYRAD